VLAAKTKSVGKESTRNRRRQLSGRLDKNKTRSKGGRTHEESATPEKGIEEAMGEEERGEVDSSDEDWDEAELDP
jgi:hypothetical protein